MHDLVLLEALGATGACRALIHFNQGCVHFVGGGGHTQ